MATRPVLPDTSLEISRTLAAPIEKVFDAFTKPEIMERWFTQARKQEQTVTIIEQDLRVGGFLRLENTLASGEVYRLECEYREVTPPRRLVFTFVWTSHPGHGDSVVTLELTPLDSQRTRVFFRQEGFLSVKARRDHEGGWKECFDVLEEELPNFLK